MLMNRLQPLALHNAPNNTLSAGEYIHIQKPPRKKNKLIVTQKKQQDLKLSSNPLKVNYTQFYII